jgi:hypothetical protein
VRHRRLRAFALLVGGFPIVAAPAAAQSTTPATVPTGAETQSFTLTIPPPPPPPSASRSGSGGPTGAVALPNRSRAEPAAAPLPRRLAYTGSDPLPIIAGGLGVVLLSLLARRWTRARLRARAGV